MLVTTVQIQKALIVIAIVNEIILKHSVLLLLK